MCSEIAFATLSFLQPHLPLVPHLTLGFSLVALNLC